MLMLNPILNTLKELNPSKAWVRVAFYHGKNILKQKYIQFDGDYSIGKTSNIQMTFNHRSVSIILHQGQIWLDNKRLLERATYVIGNDSTYCEVDCHPAVYARPKKWSKTFALAFSTSLLLVMWWGSSQRFLDQDAIPVIANWQWSPQQILEQSYFHIKNDDGFQSIYFNDSPTGPIHQPDDASSGVAFYTWYRSQIKSSPLLPSALRLYQRNPQSQQAHWMLGMYAYTADDPQLALWHYHHIDKGMAHGDLYYRKALACRRLGLHDKEERIIRELHQEHPTNKNYIAAYANVLIRKNNLAEAEIYVNKLQKDDSDKAMSHYIYALWLMKSGHEKSSIDELTRTFYSSQSFTQSQRDEFVRDLALDPMFSQLRKNGRLYNLLVKFYGSEAPLR